METKTSQHFYPGRQRGFSLPGAGQSCIYVQSATIAYGRLRHLEETPSGLKIALDIIPADGLADMSEEILFFTPWKELTAADNYLCFHTRGWQLFFNPILVQHVLNTAREKAKAPAEVRYLRLKEILSIGNRV